MHPVLLVTALHRFIEGVVAEFVLSTGKGEEKAPKVVEGYLPLKGQGEDPDFPHVVVRLISGEDDEEQGTVVVKILVGTHKEDPQGWKDAANVIIRIRNSLLIHRTLDHIYRMELPLKWELFDPPPYPEWIGEILTTWIVPRPVEPMEEADYGE